MRVLLPLALAALPCLAWAQPPSIDDPTLAALLQETLDHNPDLARGRALTQAERERVPQAGALPDPSLSLGIQNDGFKKLQIGEMESSYYQVMVTQPLPWPGKRGLRTDIARLGSQAAEASQSRIRLGLEAEVRRAYVALLLTRGQLGLLGDQALFLEQAEATARARYEVGQGSQADLLRAQLERTRLEQTRLALGGEERSALALLNRLRTQPPDAPIATPRPLDQMPEPQPIQPAAALAEATEASPELKAARLGLRQAEKALDLAQLDRRPDFAVSAGLMPRGSLDPMWTAGVSITLPLWGNRKQARAVAEQDQRRRASGSEAESVAALLAQRNQERAAQMDSALATLRLFRGGLLVQSEAAFRATLAQYEAGRVPFLSVLESLNGWVADRSGLLQAQARAQAIAIAQAELTLASVPPIGASSLGSGSMGAGAPAPSFRAGTPAKAAAAQDSSSMSSM
jgi:outer membrane protein TolC